MSTPSGWLIATATILAKELAETVPLVVLDTLCHGFTYSPAILLVGYVFHPIDGLAVEFFLNSDMTHGGGRRSAVPMLLTWRKPHDIARPDLLDRPPARWTQPRPVMTISVWPSGCVCQAVRAPGSNVTRAPATRAGSGGLNSGSIRTVPVNHSAGPLPDGCAPLRLISIANLPNCLPPRPELYAWR